MLQVEAAFKSRLKVNLRIYQLKNFNVGVKKNIWIFSVNNFCILNSSQKFKTLIAIHPVYFLSPESNIFDAEIVGTAQNLGQSLTTSG